MNYDKLIKNIEVLSARKGVKKINACIESGVGKNFLSNLYRGSEPRAEKIKQLADYFNVSTDYLLGNENGSDNTPATERQLKFALFGTADIDDSILEDVKNIAKVLAKKKDDDNKEESDNDNTQ